MQFFVNVWTIPFRVKTKPDQMTDNLRFSIEQAITEAAEKLILVTSGA